MNETIIAALTIFMEMDKRPIMAKLVHEYETDELPFELSHNLSFVEWLRERRRERRLYRKTKRQ